MTDRTHAPMAGDRAPRTARAAALTRAAAVAATALALVACAIPPSPTAPALPPLPADWGGTAASPAGHALSLDAMALGDAALRALIDEALQTSADVRRAMARVAEARALAGVSAADQGPQIGVQAGASRARGSAATGAVPAGAPLAGRLSLGVQAAWEVDLWGRLGQATAAAQADARASEADLAAVRLTVAADVARLYLGLRAVDEQRALLRESIGVQREALALQQRRAQAGVISDYELRQLEAEIATLEATLPDLDAQQSRQTSALLLLLGRPARDVFAGQLRAGAPAPLVAPQMPAWLPSELLLRRPDLLRAQQRLVAAQARIEVARKAGWPSLNLVASVGSDGARLSDLFSGPAFVWSVGAQAAATLFDSGRRESATDAARARQQQALVDWEAAIAGAFRDVRDALSAQAAADAAERAQRERVGAQARVLELAQLRFERGVASQLDVLDARRALTAARRARVDAALAQRQARIDLVKALGGGWVAPSP